MGMGINCGKEGVKRNRLCKGAKEGDITRLQASLVGKERKGGKGNEATLHYSTLHYNCPCPHVKRDFSHSHLPPPANSSRTPTR